MRRGLAFEEGAGDGALGWIFIVGEGIFAPGGEEFVARLVLGHQPVVPLFLEDAGVRLWEIGEFLNATPEENGVFVVDFDHADGRFVGEAGIGVFVEVGEQVGGVLFVGLNQLGVENGNDLVVVLQLVGVFPFVGAGVLS